MKEITINLLVEDQDAEALLGQLAEIVDDEGDHGQWTHLSMRLSEWGNGGTLPPQHPVKIESFGVDA